MSYDYYPPYVSVATKRAKAEKKLKQLKKKNKNILPIIITGRALANTWWAKSWNKNLEQYADFTNRIGRGRSYVRHGAVLDLQITFGKVSALVQGSRSQPYSIEVEITPLSKKDWDQIKNKCKGKLSSLSELLQGKFPKQLGEIFTDMEAGLFPSPDEIKFSCSCPDWAYMCKHVAASLYGIGARLDDSPELFFTLRQIDINDLISETVKDNTLDLLSKSKKKSKKIIDDTDANIADVFGIDFDIDIDKVVDKDKDVGTFDNRNATDKADNKSKSTKKKSVKKLKAKKINKIKTAKKIKTQKTLHENSKKNEKLPIDTIASIIKRSKKGIGVETLMKKTKLTREKIYYFISKLKEKNIIKNKDRGIYIKY